MDTISTFDQHYELCRKAGGNLPFSVSRFPSVSSFLRLLLTLSAFRTTRSLRVRPLDQDRYAQRQTLRWGRIRSFLHS